MFMRLTCITIIGLMIAGCTLSNNDPADAPTQTPIVITATPNPTNIPAPTSTPAPTNTPSATACVPRTDWISYTVVTGDTLADIANRASTTTSALIAANCLENPDLLNVGQTLRVPQPPSSKPPPTIPGSSYKTYNGALTGVAFDYPSNWILTENPGGPVTGVKLESYILNEAYVGQPGWLEMTISHVPNAIINTTDLQTWVEQEKVNMNVGPALEVFEEITIPLPYGNIAIQLTLVSGSGNIIRQVYSFFNGQPIRINAFGDFSLVPQILNTLRPI